MSRLFTINDGIIDFNFAGMGLYPSRVIKIVRELDDRVIYEGEIAAVPLLMKDGATQGSFYKVYVLYDSFPIFIGRKWVTSGTMKIKVPEKFKTDVKGVIDAVLGLRKI